MIPILLVVSKDDKGRERYINDFVKTHSLTAPSIFYYRKNPNVITMDQIREIQSFLTRTAQPKKLFIIDDFETARKETQSAFLKTLEEWGDKAYFVLVSTAEGPILPTVISRCVVRKLKSKNGKGKIHLSEKDDFLVHSLTELFAAYTVSDREKAVRLCEEFLMTMRDMMRHVSGDDTLSLYAITQILKEIVKTRNLILKNNLNPQIAIDHLIFVFKDRLSIDKNKQIECTK